MLADPIYVTRPFLPPLSELLPMLESIWETRVLTNLGPHHVQLEAKLRSMFEAENVTLVANGMLALWAAFEAAQLEGEVITTPYSFVATSHAVKLARLQPVFVDVRPSDLNIDPAKIEAAVTPRTRAIASVHVYGNACDVEEIDDIAQRHGLTVIYDAAHAFGVRYKGRSLLSWGDYATLSFHATKAFNTFEGGAIVSRSASKVELERLRNFGIQDEVQIPGVGTNAKMSEFNAALGLLQLDYFEQVRAARAQVDQHYRASLADIEGISVIDVPKETVPNYSYFPILVGPEYRMSRDGLYAALREQGIYSRRYFYPLLSSLPMYRSMQGAGPENLPVATRAAEQILCLPIYPGLERDDQDRIVSVIRRGA